MTNRKVVSDDGHGRQEVSVTQVGRWRFGPFKGTFTVNLAVTQDRKHGTVDFKLVPAHGGFMKNFTGSWTVAPYNEDSLDELVRYPGRHWGPIHGFKKAIHHLEEAVGVKHPEGSLVQLRQCVAPSILPPPPFDKMLRKITTAQVRLVMEDLLAEAERRNAERRQKGGSGDPQALESHVRKLQ